MYHTVRRALPLVLALAAPLSAQYVVAYHGVDGGAHQDRFDDLAPRGYRMLSLTTYGGNSDPRYAAVWVQEKGPDFIGFHGLTGDEYQQLVDDNAGEYTPAILTATGPGNDPRIAGVLEYAGKTDRSLHGIDLDSLNTEIRDARDANRRIRTIDVYGDSDDTRYIVSFAPNPENIGWGLYHASGVSEHQSWFDAMNDAFARPVQVVFNDDSSVFSALWQDTMVGLVIAHHDMSPQDYDDRFDEYAERRPGYYPIHVAASGNGANARFAALWATTHEPIQRQWSTSGMAVPQLAAFDDWVEKYMKSNATRGASLAVVKDGRLVLARGYTWAEPGYPQIQPDSLYRTASTTKPLTSIAVHQEMALQPNAIGYDSAMADYFGNPTYADDRSNSIQVMHLLTHTSGWDRQVEDTGFDPMFIDRTVADAAGLSLPISTTDIRNYMDGQNLDFAPGGRSAYSNYGYSLLGRILENLNPGQSYDDILQARIFAPLGISRATIGDAHIADVLPGEVMYHPRTLWVAQSVNDSDEPWAPGHYGSWNQPNLDAHGGHVMAAVDYAKILAAFGLGAQNPILGPVQTANMWTAPDKPFVSTSRVDSTWLKGWFRNGVTDTTGAKIDMFWHSGWLPGGMTFIGHREDNISFVLFTNGDGPLDDGTALSGIANGVAAWPAHDLFPSVGIPALQHVPGSVHVYGASCIGSYGTPGASYIGAPEVGRTTQLTLTLGRPSVPALCLVGTRVHLPLPAAPGCALFAMPGLWLPTTTSPLGSASVPLTFPAHAGFIGFKLAAQYAFLDSSANPLGWVTTNGLEMKLGGWLGF